LIKEGRPVHKLFKENKTIEIRNRSNIDVTTNEVNTKPSNGHEDQVSNFIEEMDSEIIDQDNGFRNIIEDKINNEGMSETAFEEEYQITSKELIPSFWLSQIIVLLPGIVFLWFFYLRKGFTLNSFFSTSDVLEIVLGGTLVALFGIGLQWVSWKIFSIKAFDDGGINRILVTLPIHTLMPMFAFGAFAEEVLVRGVLQSGLVYRFGTVSGVFLTSFVFTVIHFRYLKKPVLMGGVFLISLILGLLYGVTGTLWSTVWAHFLYNLGAAILAKKIYPNLFIEEI
jgi:uncharacterized protein